jgi:hypothetical protein
MFSFAFEYHLQYEPSKSPLFVILPNLREKNAIFTHTCIYCRIITIVVSTGLSHPWMCIYHWTCWICHFQSNFIFLQGFCQDNPGHTPALPKSYVLDHNCLVHVLINCQYFCTSSYLIYDPKVDGYVFLIVPV